MPSISSVPGRLGAAFLCAASLAFSGLLHAAVITTGTPTASVPSALIDPLATLSSPLPSNWYLLPIEISGATGLQDWSFDLLFDAGVVTPIDAGGLYQSVYQAQFNVIDTTASNIDSGGLLLNGVLLGIAGFSSGVTGDGLLAYILFELTSGGDVDDAGFRIDNAVIRQQVPEPGTLALLVAAALSLSWIRWRRVYSRRPATP